MQVKQRRLLLPWFALIPIAYALPFLCDRWQTYRNIVGHDLNRWIHFIVFAVLSAVPVAALRKTKDILASYIPVVPAVLIESFHPTGSIAACAQNIPADLFGMASGLLLGLNLHTMSAGVVRNARAGDHGPA